MFVKASSLLAFFFNKGNVWLLLWRQLAFVNVPSTGRIAYNVTMTYNYRERNRVDEIYNRHAYFEKRKATRAKLGEWRASIVNGSETNKIVDFDTVCKS